MNFINYFLICSLITTPLFGMGSTYLEDDLNFTGTMAYRAGLTIVASDNDFGGVDFDRDTNAHSDDVYYTSTTDDTLEILVKFNEKSKITVKDVHADGIEDSNAATNTLTFLNTAVGGTDFIELDLYIKDTEDMGVGGGAVINDTATLVAADGITALHKDDATGHEGEVMTWEAKLNALTKPFFDLEKGTYVANVLFSIEVDDGT